MKRALLFVAAVAAMTIQASAFDLESSNIDAAGAGMIETKVDDVASGLNFGLKYVADSTGNHQYFIRFNITDAAHYISPNRIALIKFSPKENIKTLELRAAYQVSGKKKVKSFMYKFQSFNQVLNGPYNAAAATSILDEDDRYNIEPLSNTYYPISDEDLQNLMKHKVEKLRFDTSDKIIEINGTPKLNTIFSEAYQAIQNCLTKDVRAGF